jgi:protoheme IX farnesyltransferase
VKQTGRSNKVKDYMLLMKFTLSFTVVFSCVLSYLLVPGVFFNLKMVSLLFLGGMLVTGAANAINQIVEKETDAMMKRTSSRPVASGRMSETEAWLFVWIAGALGALILWYYFNWMAALWSVFSLFLYAFIYTPLKKVNSIAVLVGAVPGALPCLIGWVAGADEHSAGGWVLFGIQFFWQLPHFWAIAWVAHSDYSKAGFRFMLPTESGPTKFTAIQTIIYSLMLIPLCLLTYFFDISGLFSMILIFIANLIMTYQCIRLYKEMSVQAARRVMFTSYIYLPVVLLFLYADKSGNLSRFLFQT